MKTEKATLILALFLLLVMGFPSIAMAHTEEDPFATDLIAGGGNPKSAIDVGDVLVWNDNEYLYVKYTTTDGWVLTETHLAVADSLEGIPQTKKSNPIPGQFSYSMIHDPPVTEYTYVIPLTWDSDTSLFIAAHAVVQLEETCPAIMYGTSLGTSGVGDKIYEIDVSTLTATELFDTGLSPSSINGPNGNAYDPVNNWLYYSRYTSPDYLYFYDFTNPANNPSGSLPGGMVACAGWYNGKYYYIPQQTGKLYEVTFNLDGTINTATKICEYSGKSFNFGDVVVTSNGLMYGSSAVNGVGKFWSIDLNDCTYTEISTMAHMQLAFGSDGVLYSHDAGNANFYTIDPVLGTRTEIDSIDGLKFTDLASGPYEPCTYQTETAWGDGFEFLGKNWATYFTYGVQPLIVRYPETGDAYIGYEDWPNGDFDYNDFGMTFSATEIYERIDGQWYLTEVTMVFQAVIYDSGGDHDIHIARPIVGPSTYTVTRSIPAYGTETLTGTHSGSGAIDVVLFDTSKYGWPAKKIDEVVQIVIDIGDPASNPKTALTPPRTITNGGVTFTDLDPFMANYDPWIYGKTGIINGATWHIWSVQYVTAVNSGVFPQGLDHRLIGLNLPHILVVPYTDWIPPHEDTCISRPPGQYHTPNCDYDGPYNYFYDYYSIGNPTYADWYATITNTYVGRGGISWAPGDP